MIALLQIYCWVCWWHNFENRSTFGEVMGKSIVSCFFDSQCIYIHLTCMQNVLHVYHVMLRYTSIGYWNWKLRNITVLIRFSHQVILKFRLFSVILFIKNRNHDEMTRLNHIRRVLLIMHSCILRLSSSKNLAFFWTDLAVKYARFGSERWRIGNPGQRILPGGNTCKRIRGSWCKTSRCRALQNF